MPIRLGAADFRASTSVVQSRLRTHNQKMTVAAMHMALMEVRAQRSYRVAIIDETSAQVGDLD